jgi:MerR family regulatory protein
MRAITISRAENLPIGELSRLSGVNIETIRYYEKSKIQDLAKLERLLARTIAQCSGRSVPDCPILDILDVQRSKQSRQANPE